MDGTKRLRKSLGISSTRDDFENINLGESSSGDGLSNDEVFRSENVNLNLSLDSLDSELDVREEVKRWAVRIKPFPKSKLDPFVVFRSKNPSKCQDKYLTLKYLTLTKEL